MKGEIAAFFKGFVYALRGIIYCIKNERNMRFHICAAVTVAFLSRFYSLSRGEYALLAVIFASVISAEAINTAVERAVDLTCGGKREPLAEAAKNCAAGAVLISALFAAAAGVILFFDTEVLRMIASFFAGNRFYTVLLVIYAAACFWFVFGIKNNKDRKG